MASPGVAWCGSCAAVEQAPHTYTGWSPRESDWSHCRASYTRPGDQSSTGACPKDQLSAGGSAQPGRWTSFRVRPGLGGQGSGRPSPARAGESPGAWGRRHLEIPECGVGGLWRGRPEGSRGQGHPLRQPAGARPAAPEGRARVRSGTSVRLQHRRPAPAGTYLGCVAPAPRAAPVPSPGSGPLPCNDAQQPRFRRRHRGVTLLRRAGAWRLQAPPPAPRPRPLRLRSPARPADRRLPEASGSEASA